MMNLRRHIFRRIRPPKRPVHLHRHELLRPRAIPASWCGPKCPGFVELDRLLLDVAAHTQGPHAIEVPEIITEIEFAEVERDEEFGVVGIEPGCAAEDDEEVGPEKKVGRSVSAERAYGLWTWCVQVDFFLAELPGRQKPLRL